MSEQLELGFRAFDPHELLCHFLAHAAGYYREAGIRLRLADLTFRADPTLTDTTVQASCAAALLGALTGGSYRIALVAANQPMFWLYADHRYRTLRDLAGERLATYPPLTPPAQFLRIIVSAEGLDPDSDLQLEHTRDDTARVGLLLAGEVEAALLSSAVAAPRMLALGYTPLLCLGDIVNVPTTGLAVPQQLARNEPKTVHRLVQTWRAALADLHAGGSAVQSVVETAFSFSPAEARWTVAQAQRRMTSDGQLLVEDARQALRNLAMHLGHGREPPVDTVFLEHALAT